MQLFRIGLILVFWMVGNTTAADDVTSTDVALDNVIADYWDSYLESDPIAATGVGVNDFNDILPTVTARAQSRQFEANRGFLRRFVISIEMHCLLQVALTPICWTGCCKAE